MVVESTDPGVKFVLDNIQTVVASEGGSLEFLDLKDGRLSVRYHKGRNDDCPECVPDHQLVRMMMERSLSTHAPDVREIDLL